MKQESLNIFLINADWRDIFREDRQELIEKLERDQLEPKVHSFFFLSWSNKAYHARDGFFETVHLPLMITSFKPLADILLWIVGPVVMWRYHVRPDVVIVYDFGSVPAARAIAHWHGVPLVMYVNNMPQLYSRTRRFGWVKSWYSALLERLWYRLPDAYCTINDTMRTYLCNLGIPAQKIFHYRVDTIVRDTEHVVKAQRGIVRKKLGIPTDARVILTVGRLEAEKNHHRLLRYMAHTPEMTHLVILGQGSLLHELQQLARDLGLEKRIHFEGFVQRDQIWNYYKDADAFVLLSRAEALGIVFWEAMCVRTPVMGSALPGIIESLGAHNERGIVVPDDASAETFIELLDATIESSDEHYQRIERAYQFVVEQNRRGITIRGVVQAIKRS